MASLACKKGLSLAFSHISATSRRARIQIFGRRGKRPSGRNPPSSFANRTTTTSRTAAGHSSKTSQRARMHKSPATTYPVRQSSVRGCMACHASPVRHGNVASDALKDASITGGGGPPMLSFQMGSVQLLPLAHSVPHTLRASLTVCWASNGDATPSATLVTAASWTNERPSSSAGIQLVAVRVSMCWRLRPLHEPSCNHIANFVAADKHASLSADSAILVAMLPNC